MGPALGIGIVDAGCEGSPNQFDPQIPGSIYLWIRGVDLGQSRRGKELDSHRPPFVSLGPISRGFLSSQYRPQTISRFLKDWVV
jgi:hypothetical protein